MTPLDDGWLDDALAAEPEPLPEPEPPPLEMTIEERRTHGQLGVNWVVGPPGTGKTTFLARQILFDASVRGSDAVVALSHTKAAAAEIAMRHVPLSPDNVGTLHSLAYRALGRPTLVETDEHLREFGDAHPAFPMSATYSLDDMEALLPSKARGDNLLQEYARHRNLEVPRELWPSVELINFAEAWEDYKRQVGGIDFTDMIALAATDTDAPEAHPSALIVDEGQDLSRLQFRLLQRWARSATKMTMAFDADQSIYGFAGADPTVFLENEPDQLKVLGQSHRVPRQVHRLAMRWIRQARRRDVEYLPTADEGELDQADHQWRRPETLLRDVERDLRADRTVMVLTSCGYMLDPLIKLLRQEGFPFCNPYRRKQGAWNPMRGSAQGTPTHERVAALLAPWQPGAERLWTKAQLLAWTDLLKEVFRRGGRAELEKIRDDADDDAVLCALVEACASDEHAAAATSAPPACLDWLEAHLRKDKIASAGYAIAVGRRFGSPGLTERPRLIVGTIHSVKGGEADSVYLFPDLSPEGSARYGSRTGGRDEVVRQFYVGMTRARRKLCLCAQSGPAVEWGL